MLDSEDSGDICGELGEVWSKWYEIGVPLKIPTADLDDIQLQTSGSKESFRVDNNSLLDVTHSRNS